MRHFMFIVAAMPLATGCGPHSLADVAGFADQFCELADTCCAKAGLPTDGKTCQQNLARTTESEEYDATAGASCIEAIRAARNDADFCNSFGNAEPCGRVFAVNDVFELRLMGAPCVESSGCTPEGPGFTLVADCVDGAYCDSTTGACEPRPAVGEKCSALDDPCEASAYCSAKTGTCQTPVGVGGDCSGSTGACDASGYCDTTTAKIADWRCKTKLAVGAACTSGRQCQSEFCTDGACIVYPDKQQRWLLVCGTD